MVKYCIVQLFAFCTATCLCGQSPYVHVISQEMGLGRASVSCLLQDHQGIIWAGTEYGLLRFDGLRTTTYLPEKNNPNSISNEFIYDIFEDSRRCIWISTRNGLNKLDPSRKRFTRYQLNTANEYTVPNNRIFNLLPDTDSTFFLLCDRSGLSSFNVYTDRVTRLNPKVQSKKNGLHGHEAWTTYAAMTANGRILAAATIGLYEYDRQSNTLIDVEDSTGYHDIPDKSTYVCDRQGYMWFIDRQGHLYKWLPGVSLNKFSWPELIATLTSGRVRMWDYKVDEILISVASACYIVNKQTGKIKPFQTRADQVNFFQTDPVTSSFEIQDGIVVLGSAKGNLYLINPYLQFFKFENIIQKDVPPEGGVNDIFDDLQYQKRYMSASHDSFFYVQDLVSEEVTAHTRNRVSPIPERWTMSKSGKLWLCNGTHVLEIDRLDQSTTSYYPELPARDLFEMIEIQEDYMLVGSFREGLYRFNPLQRQFQKIPEEKGWKRTQIFSLKYDAPRKTVWIGTVRNGLFRYDMVRDTFIQYVYDSQNRYSIGGDWVRDIAIDSAGSLWFSTDPVGLSRFDYNAHPDSAFLNVSVADGLPSCFIAGLCVDAGGKLWMTSLNGIASLDPVTLEIKTYGKSDGLNNTRFVHGNMNVAADHTIMFGNGKGYYYFHPDSVVANSKQPDLVINDFLVFDESRYTLQENGHFVAPQLSYKDNYITICFSVTNYTESEFNTVRYKMDGLKDQWTLRSGISQVSYTSMPPGKYTFRLQAANNSGLWNPEEMQIPIVIRPPFWRQMWFYLLLVALVAGMLFALYRYKLNQSLREARLLTEKERLKVESEHKLLQLEMTALRAQMNPHFIFNCLNAINRFIIIDENDAASEYLTKFSKLIRQVLDNSRGEKVNLNNEVETLSLYVEMESLRFVDKFEYEIILPPGRNTEDYLIQPMLIQPYVENAIWHGLMHLKSRGKLHIRFQLDEMTLRVFIEDNGIGRAASKELKHKQLITRKSHGMKVTAERMSLLSKKLDLPVEAQVEDLYDDNQRPVGTRVTLTLPVEVNRTESKQIDLTL